MVIKAARLRSPLCLAALASLLVGTAPLRAACPANTGAVGTPSTFWGALQPTDVGSVPGDRDTTNYTGGKEPLDSRTPLFSSIDVEDGYAFTSYMFGFQVWDVKENPDQPSLKAAIDQAPNCDRTAGDFLENPGCQEQRWLLWDLDAPRGDSNILALSGLAPLGVSIWDTSNKQNPKILYQDKGRTAHQVYATTIGDRPYAFAAASGPGAADTGLHIYDMQAALVHGNSGCLENSSEQPVCGVYKGELSSSGFNYVDGFTSATGRTYIAASGGPGDSFGLGASGVKIWDVTDPRSPNEIGTFFGSEFINGVAIWEQNGRQFVGVQPFGANARIHEITNCLSGGCASPPLRWTSSWPASLLTSVRWVTYSNGGDGTGYLYFGTENLCIDEVQGEWIYDLSALSSGSSQNTKLDEITPEKTQVIGGKTTGYWSHYYPTRSSGFNRLYPRVGKIYGNHFYRAAWTLFDVHQLVSVDPKITVSGPSTGYAGTAATFTATATSCSPNPSGWSWSTSGGTGAGSSATANITWSTTGNKTVSATNSACPGATVVGADIQVVDPAPQVASVSKSPTSPVVCQPVTLTADGVTGQPPLTFAWTVKDSSGSTVATGGNANPFVWDTSQPIAAADIYTATVTVTGVGSPAAQETSVTLGALTPLPGPGQFSPTHDAFQSGTVQFHVNVPGATEWSWDFGDGNGYTDWTSDPDVGPSPVKSYTSIGTKNVKVQVRNCQQPAGVESAVLEVEILQTTPLHAEFKARTNCQVAPCLPVFNVGEAIRFDDHSTGAELYDYDWDGNGSYEDAGHAAPVTTHTYPSAGEYSPKLRVRRGASESDVFTHSRFTVEPAQPANLSIAGSTGGQVGQTLTFSASASNCSPAPSGWTWSATGVSVSDTDSSIAVSFSSAGNKTITVRNSACGSAQATRLVSISNGGGAGGGGGGGGGNGFNASFSFSPAEPAAGQTVTFDGGASTGPNLAYFWEFGDGSNAFGRTTTHVFETAKSYQVKLTVSDSTCLSAGCTSSTSTKTVTVGNGGPTVEATFDTSASCVQQFGIHSCNSTTGQKVGFTGTTQGAAHHEWDFGDGTTATGKSVTHTWTQPGSYAVAYTATSEGVSDTSTRTFVVTGAPVSQLSSVVVPWIARAEADKALPQSSDLDVHNPGTEPLTVRLTFRKRGLPEPDPPQVEQTIAPNGTLHVPDAMAELFDRPNLSGFVFVEPVEGAGQPVVTSANHTFREDGAVFGQVVPGLRVDGSGVKAGAGATMTHLVGLNANDERLAYFGISNPNDEPFFYHLRFYDSLGRLVGGTETPEAVARFGQKQYQSEDLALQFGIDALDDYRIEIVPEEEGSPVPFVYGANLRRKSFDPSFVRGGRTDASEVFLVGALNTPGLNDSFFRSDVVLGNTAGEEVLCDLTFTGAGFRTEPTSPITEILQPGESLRMADVVSEWNVGNAVGALRIVCDAPGGVFPVIQGESYDASKPDEFYGQFMPALTEDDAAVAGGSHTLVGLRKDDEHRTTVWLFNPSDHSVAEYDLRYFDVNGNELGSETGVRLGRGKFRQINPEAHPLPETVPGGFVVRIDVKSGKLLTAGQVVNRTNDPAYIVGQ